MFRTSLNFVDRLDPLSFSFFVFVIVDFSLCVPVVALSAVLTALLFRTVGLPHGASLVDRFTAAYPADELALFVCLRRMASRSSLSVLVRWPHEDLLSLFQFLSGGLTRTYSLLLVVNGIGVPVHQCSGALL